MGWCPKEKPWKGTMSFNWILHCLQLPITRGSSARTKLIKNVPDIRLLKIQEKPKKSICVIILFPPNIIFQRLYTQTDSISLFGNFVLTAFRGAELEGRGQTFPKEDRLNQYLDVPCISMMQLQKPVHTVSKNISTKLPLVRTRQLFTVWKE